MTLSLPFSIRVDGSEPDIQAFAGELRSQPWFSEFHFNPVQYDTGYQLWIYSNDDDSAEDPPTQWNSAAWSHVDEDAKFLSAQSFAGLSLKKGDGKGDLFPWGTDAGAQAWVTLQFPFRRGIPAIQLLPPEVP